MTRNSAVSIPILGRSYFFRVPFNIKMVMQYININTVDTEVVEPPMLHWMQEFLF